MTLKQDLIKVRRKADRYEDARYELLEAIRHAHANGASLRVIARETGIYSHEQVRKVVSAPSLRSVAPD